LWNLSRMNEIRMPASHLLVTIWLKLTLQH
jgi:hypothetical protein